MYSLIQLHYIGRWRWKSSLKTRGKSYYRLYESVYFI